jgi:hypothetical protein
VLRFSYALLSIPFLWFLACGRETEHRLPPNRQVTTSRAGEVVDALPARSSFAGSDVCRDCHEKNFERWSHDWHARALSPAVAPNVAGRFDGSHFLGRSSEAWMTTRNRAPFMRTRDRKGKLSLFPVNWVIGGKRMQDAVTVFDDGRWQVLPVYFHITGGGAWVDYNEAKQGKVGPDHPYFWTNFRRTANKECLECHSTGLDVRYDRESHRWSTSFADAGVACEACHGPGARHAETKARADIVRADHLDREAGLAVCARCHGPHEPMFPLLDTKHQFRPGRPYADSYVPLVIVDGTERSGEFFADGRPSSSSFEYQALLQSRCYRQGGATCLTCHTAPHEDHFANEIEDTSADAPCLKCHAVIASETTGSAASANRHSHHRGVSCVACHMPSVASGVLDKFADHSIDIPNLDTTIRHGVPDACTLCHADRDPQSLALAARSWWPGLAGRTARRSRLADAIDERTAAGSLSALQSVVADRSEAPTLRGACAILLGQRFQAAAVTALVPLLRDPEALVRAKALEGLGFASARSAGDFVAPLLDDSSLLVRENAALVLSSFSDARGLTAMRNLASDPATAALVRPHIVLGVNAAQHGDFDTATRELETAVDEVPYAVDAIVMLADIRARRGDLAGARKYLEEALRFAPDHRGALQRLRVMSAPN